MDINEWEILSDDGFLDGDEKQIFLGNNRNSESVSVFDKNYFCTSPKSKKNTVHIPIQLETIKVAGDELVEENTEEKDYVGVIITEKIKAPQADEESLSHVFFQIKENKLVDMKLESPKSSGEAMEIMTSPRIKNIERENVMMDYEKEEEDMSGGFNFWKWSLTGVGAICSFGVAAATICVLFFGTQHRNKLQQDQKIRFQIYTDDNKRIKQVVQHATKLNEAFAAVRGVPLRRAHITYGGYYESL